MALHWASLAFAIAPRFVAGRKSASSHGFNEADWCLPELPALTATVADTCDNTEAIEDILDKEVERLRAWEASFLASLEFETGRTLSQWLDAIERFPDRNQAIDHLVTVGEFSFRQAAWLTNVRHNGGLPIYSRLPEIKTEPPLPPLLAIVPATLAVREFLAIVLDEAPHEMTFRQLSERYHDLGKDRGWPSLKDRGLSKHLASHGCQTRLSKRLKDGSRPTIVIFPYRRKRRGA